MSKGAPRGIGRDANPRDGDLIEFSAWIRDGKVSAEARDLGGETFGGCEVARKAALALGELVHGRTADEAFAIDVGQLIEAIGGVPVENERCVLTVIGALRSAVIDAQVKALVDATYETKTMRVK